MIRFVIPAYNEAENIPRLLADLAPVARELGARVIIVDDGSTDGTGDVIREHAQDMHLAVVTHTVNRGLGTAINTGIRSALKESSDEDAIVTLEADTTSDLSDLPRMLELFDEGKDVVLASVYAPGGKIIGVAGWRLAASKSVSNTFRYLGGLRDMHTLSSLYRIYRAGTLRKAADTYGYLLVREPGFAANVELLLKLYNAGATRRRGADDERLADPQRRVEDAAETDRARLLPGDGGADGRPHPAAAGLAAGRGDGAAGAAGARRRDRDRAARGERPRVRSADLMSTQQPRIGVVGGGVLGTSLALRLAQAGAKVTVIERGPSLGGLAGAFDFNGHEVDRFYHVVTPADQRMIEMAEEVGLGDQLRFNPVGAGFFAERRDARLQRGRRPAAVLAAEPAGTPAPGPLRRPVPGSLAPTPSSTRSRSRTGCGKSAASRSGSGSGNRCSTRASTATPRGCRPPTSGPAPGACPAPATARAAAARRWATSSAATSA